MKRDRGIGTATGTGWHRQRQGVRDSDKNSDRNSRYRDIWTGTEGEGQWDSVKDLFQTFKNVTGKHVEPFKEHLQNNYTPITKNLDY